jgi:sialic acid synthase SpsE
MGRIYIIAEAEINHNGDIETAKKMVEVAKECGADCVKFQYIIASEIADQSSPYYGLFKKAELSQGQFIELKEFAGKSVGIDFMMTVTSCKTFYLTRELGIKKIKISSSNLTNVLLLEEIGKYKSQFEIYISTGMGTLSDIELALNTLRYDNNDKNFNVFHCTSNYPADYENLNLNMIVTMKNIFRNLKVGYSDHTINNLAAIASVAIGAEILEKHFTLDKKMEGPDHFFSIDPEGLRKYILDVRNTEKALGKYEKSPAASEIGVIDTARRFIVFKTDARKGSKLNPEMFDTKRIGNAENAVEVKYVDILSKLKAARDYKAGDIIKWSDFN